MVPLLLGFLAEAILGPYVERIREAGGGHRRSVAQGWHTLPLLVMAFVIVGYGEVLMPQTLSSAPMMFDKGLFL